MLSRTGDRCDIFKRINALGEARTVGELTARLLPILGELAYCAVNGEAAVLESREEWHAQHLSALCGDTAAAPAAAPVLEKKYAARPRTRRARRDGHSAPPPRSALPPRREIPQSLQEIMDGSHQSLRES